jgi:hypothetical protein
MPASVIMPPSVNVMIPESQDSFGGKLPQEGGSHCPDTVSVATATASPFGPLKWFRAAPI